MKYAFAMTIGTVLGGGAGFAAESTGAPTWVVYTLSAVLGGILTMLSIWEWDRTDV